MELVRRGGGRVPRGPPGPSADGDGRPRPELRLRLDPLRIRQVLDNLLTNAAVHTPAGHGGVGGRSTSRAGRGAWCGSRTPAPASRPPTRSGSSTASTASTRPAAATAAAAAWASRSRGSLVRAHGGTIDADQ